MNVLSIAGSDPSSGAGIQGDIKTFEALGVYGLSTVTALTSQTTSKFYKTEPVSPEIVKSQIRSVFADFKIGAVKIGMVYDRKTIKVIYDELKRLKIPIVLDPIFQSTTGGTLLRQDAFSFFAKYLVPLAYIITPNIPEAEKITGIKIKNWPDAKKAALKIGSMGAKNTVIKGGHMEEGVVTDLLLENKKFFIFSQKRIARQSHGGGCIFSAALCASLAKGKTLQESVRLAQEMSSKSIRDASRVGSGLAVARQKSTDRLEQELAQAIGKFAEMNYIYRYIPEVQTNFVYSRPSPRDVFDILGLEGRIIKTGTSVVPAGSLKYGGSKHVGNAVLEVAKKFPAIRSGINIRYDKSTIKRAVAKRFRVTHYNRALEPQQTKGKEGSTVLWGVRNAVSKMRSPPDMIYHTGDLGKEPMILVFGRTPKDVLTKLANIV
ncbi:MAG: bifunctional hydroxymethylpyrimidine kinase/phosphomethylpyrimidine kinase [Thaumarchaeota archaeon]|nr:bifunctional hydroxymethylpyrimidine kinase/phosphomethylpyrimidine kinase [Nitrososphaerota archaeon]